MKKSNKRKTRLGALQRGIRRLNLARYLRMEKMRNRKKFASRKIAREIARTRMRREGLRRVNVRFSTRWRYYV